eukprot:366316-Chlamydomonas_euryale.AAC.6
MEEAIRAAPTPAATHADGCGLVCSTQAYFVLGALLCTVCTWPCVAACMWRMLLFVCGRATAMQLQHPGVLCTGCTTLYAAMWSRSSHAAAAMCNIPLINGRFAA